MKTSIQARLDEESSAALETLQRRLGWSSSEIVRASLRLMLQDQALQRPRKIIGQGEFDSGIPDLATNKKYLETLGQHSGLDADPRRKNKRAREKSIA
jgi:Arc/MetJ-type ribon-helix-helix transcriptional regulator